MYYRYWMHKDAAHNVWAHFGMRTHDYKIICYYADGLDTVEQWAIDKGIDRGPENPGWELFDLIKDPKEMINVYYQDVVVNLKKKLFALQKKYQDQPYEHPLVS